MGHRAHLPERRAWPEPGAAIGDRCRTGKVVRIGRGARVAAGRAHAGRRLGSAWNEATHRFRGPVRGMWSTPGEVGFAARGRTSSNHWKGMPRSPCRPQQTGFRLFGRFHTTPTIGNAADRRPHRTLLAVSEGVAAGPRPGRAAPSGRRKSGPPDRTEAVRRHPASPLRKVSLAGLSRCTPRWVRKTKAPRDSSSPASRNAGPWTRRHRDLERPCWPATGRSGGPPIALSRTPPCVRPGTRW